MEIVLRGNRIELSKTQRAESRAKNTTIPAEFSTRRVAQTLWGLRFRAVMKDAFRKGKVSAQAGSHDELVFQFVVGSSFAKAPGKEDARRDYRLGQLALRASSRLRSAMSPACSK